MFILTTFSRKLKNITQLHPPEVSAQFIINPSQKHQAKKTQTILITTKNSKKKIFYFIVLGLRILAFPCNQFAGEEPGNAEEIQCFVADRKVKFDLFDKIDVNGKDAHPLYEYLKKEQGGTLFDAIKWNFTKFIVDKSGKPVERHAPTTSPFDMKQKLEKYF